MMQQESNKENQKGRAFWSVEGNETVLGEREVPTGGDYVQCMDHTPAGIKHWTTKGLSMVGH